MMQYFMRLMSALILFMVISACKTVPDEYYTDNSLTRSQLLSGQVLLGAPIKDSELPDDHVLVMTEEMEAFLDQYVPRHLGARTKAKKLNDALFDKSKLAMVYDVSQTYTAQQAFENKTGNCLAFVYLYSVLAKELGLKVNFQEVEILPEWSRASDDLLITSRHINLQLELYGTDDLIVDIDEIVPSRTFNTIPITQSHAVALYYGNLGTNFMLDKEYEKAIKYFIKGLKLEPTESSLWTNLGVLYRQNGFNDYAERAYFMALEYDKSNGSSLNNLAYLYSQTGDIQKAKYYAKLSESHQLKNPFYRYGQARNDLDEGHYKSALIHIKYAIRINNEIAQFYILQSEIYQRLGNLKEAQKAFRVAENLKAA